MTDTLRTSAPSSITPNHVISPGDFDELYAAGATAIFPPGTVIADAAIGLLHTLAKRLEYDLD
jgi:methylmalonyl-CoA mutase